jgi:hypothetical protein
VRRLGMLWCSGAQWPLLVASYWPRSSAISSRSSPRNLLICSTVVALAGLVVDERPPQRVDAAPETGPTASATPAQRCAVFGDEHSTIR